MTNMGKMHHLAVRTVFFFVVFCIISIWFQHPSAHADTVKSAQTASQTITVAKGMSTHDVFVVGKTVQIDGNVTDNLVALDSTVYIHKGAHVDMLLALGGNVVIDPGAHVHDQLVFSPTLPFINHVAYGVAFVAVCLLVQLLISVVIVFVSILFSVLLKSFAHQFIAKPRHLLRQRLGIGLVLMVALAALAFGFALTGVGIPVAVFVVLCTGIAVMIGMAPLATLIGHAVVRNQEKATPTWILSLIGSIILVGLMNIPVIGLFILLAAVFIALGSLIHYVIGFRRTDAATKE